MKIFFIGAVKFSELAFQRLIEINSKVVEVCTLKESRINADHEDMSLLSRNFKIPVRYTPNINSVETVN